MELLEEAGPACTGLLAAPGAAGAEDGEGVAGPLEAWMVVRIRYGGRGWGCSNEELRCAPLRP